MFFLLACETKASRLLVSETGLHTSDHSSIRNDADTAQKTSENMWQRDAPLQILLKTPFKGMGGIVLVMVGNDGCPTSAAYRPIYEANATFSNGIKKFYIDNGELSKDAQYLPTPFFIYVENGVPLDVHAGVVHPVNSFAEEVNARIFEHIFIRNNFMDGDEWELAQNKFSENADGRNFDYKALNFLNLKDLDFGTSSFKRALFSGVNLQNANLEDASFDHTIMAHVDLRGARLRAEQVSDIIWVWAICPDGTESATHGNTCAGHLNVSQ